MSSKIICSFKCGKSDDNVIFSSFSLTILYCLLFEEVFFYNNNYTKNLNLNLVWDEMVFLKGIEKFAGEIRNIKRLNIILKLEFEVKN